MRRLRATVALACVLLAAAPATAGRGPDRRDARGFRLAVPPYTYEFPRDHASHPEYAVEWWYYTGHLESRARRFGYELTFFRVGVAPAGAPPSPGSPSPAAPPASSPSAWRARDVLFAHLALTDESKGTFHHHERAQRPALGRAGADTARYRTWIGDWSATLAPDGVTHRLDARADDFAFALDLVPTKPPAVHGVNGVSQKTAGEGNASHYVSLTRMATSGRLVVDGDTLAVSGASWMDHEWGSGRLTNAHAGWDWFSVQLGDGRELMLYRLRLKSGAPEPFSAGTVIAKDGRTRHLTLADFDVRPTGRWKSPESGADYPHGWRVRVASEGLDLTIDPTVKAQELIARAMGGVVYWEGACRVQGTSRGTPVTGRAYVELTGYAGAPPF